MPKESLWQFGGWSDGMEIGAAELGCWWLPNLGQGPAYLSGLNRASPCTPLSMDASISDLPLLAEFPDLPQPLTPLAWSSNIRQAHQSISNTYSSSLEVIRQDDSDPLRLRFHENRLLNEIFPLLVALEEQQEQPLPSGWLELAAKALAALVVRFQKALENTDE